MRCGNTCGSSRWSIGFSLVDQTKVVTAASELARNTLIYGKGGWCDDRAGGGGRPARVCGPVFEDQGPGIADIERALQDGFTTGGGLGLGLGGAKRLSNEFEIVSTAGAGDAGDDHEVEGVGRGPGVRGRGRLAGTGIRFAERWD